MKLMTEILGEVDYKEENVIYFSEGLYGFENCHRFILIDIAETEMPFQWLQSVEDESLSFVLTTPFAFHESYDFEIPEHVIKQLEISNTDELAIYSLVVIKENLEESTTNLKAPLIVNVHKNKAKQIILNEDFPYKYFLFNRQEA